MSHNKRNQTPITKFFKKVQKLTSNESGENESIESDSAQVSAAVSTLTPNVILEDEQTPKDDQSFEMDLGLYVNKDPSSASKYITLVKTPWMPGSKYMFPKSGQRNLSFQPKWCAEFNWLVYSHSLKGALCKFCVLFAKASSIIGNNKQQLGSLVSAPFVTWCRAKQSFNDHQTRQHHKDSILYYNDLLKSQSSPTDHIENQLVGGRLDLIRKNRERLIPIFEAILFCGRQEIALRGHADSGPLSFEEPKEKDGNFRALLRMRAYCGDEKLLLHLNQMSNAVTYLSPDIQNDIIECYASYIQEKLVHRINSAKCFSLIADETTDISGVEQLSICIRYIENNYLREDFVGFVPLIKTTGEEIAQAIIDNLKTLNINLEYLRGQGFDGAGAMSGKISGVQTIIRDRVRKEAIYVHCSSHSLNLALSDSCIIPEIRNTLGVIQKTITFVTRSAIRLSKLKECIQAKYKNVQASLKLLGYCETRFVERHDAVLRFVELYDCIVDTLGAIECDGDRDAKVMAHALLTSILNSTFIVSMYICEEVLACTVYLSMGLQDPQYDLVRALRQIDNCLSTLNSWRANPDNRFHNLFLRAEECGKKQFINVEAPRTIGRQKHRSNIPSSTPEEYFKRNVYINFLDHIMSSLTARFQKHRNVVQALQQLIPSVIKENTKQISIDEMLHFYEADLVGSAATTKVEINVWEESWKSKNKESCPRNALDAFMSCDKSSFLNIKNLLKILATLPVTSCTSERSFSTVRRVKSFLRSNTGENRLNGLALMSIHREIEIIVLEVIDLFAKKKSRRLNLTL